MEWELQPLTMAGTTLADRYKVERLLGEGGMGSVYLATDQLLGRQVAIKIMKAGPLGGQNAARFLREARSLARLNHPNIVTLYDYGYHGEQAYLVMEFAAGVSLSAMLEGPIEPRHDTGKAFTLNNALDIAISVTRALSYAHHHGVIHRDIKPGNVMIGNETKLMDFGIAKVRQDTSITMASAGVGTPVYMAPEQVLGKDVDERSDLYSLGVVLYEMLTGRPPFLPSDEMSIVSQHIQVTPVAPYLRNASIPKRLDHLILTLLAKDPNRRPATADEVLLELEAVKQEMPAESSVEMPKRREVSAVDQTKTEALRNMPLFAAISWDDLSQLSSRLTRRRYREGEVIFHKGDFGSTLHMIKTGNVKISLPAEEEEGVVLAYLGPGQFFGELALLDESPRSATVTAVEATETLALERADFLDFLKWYPDAAIRILAVLSQRLRHLNSQLEDIIFSNPQARLAKTLLKLGDSCGKETPEGREISVPLTLADLAGMAGVSIAATRRLLRNFQAAGVASARNRCYIIHNLGELQRCALKGTATGSSR